jgi:hypothetical protein
MGQVAHQHNTSFQFLQQNESNHLHKPKLVTDWCRPIQIRPQTIVAWTRYATNYFSSNDYGIAMFHWIFLNCRTKSISQWWAPLNFPHTIPTHTFLNLQSLKSQNKCLIPNIPSRLTSINIWISKASWRCINFQLKDIHTIILVWIALWPWGYVSPSFCGSKNFLTFQMRYPNNEGHY